MSSLLVDSHGKTLAPIKVELKSVPQIVIGIRRKGRQYVSRIDLTDTMKGFVSESRNRRLSKMSKKSQNPELARMLGVCGMAARLFDHGRDAFNTKLISWTGDTQKALLLDTTASGTWLKEITAATNASPVVYTSASHGFSNTDVLVVGGIGGNLSANQTGLAASVATNTFDLTTLEGQTVAGSAAYTAGGYAVDLTQATFVADILGNRVGTDPTISGTSSSKGIANATSPITWSTVPSGNAAQAVLFYDAAGGTDASNRLIGWQDGKIRVVTVGDTPSSSTTMKVQPIRAQLWDGSTGSAPVLWFSNGYSVTLNAAAVQGADSLTVTSTGHDIPDLSTAEGTDFGGGLPFTPSGGNFSFNIGTIYFPNTPTGIYVL
jgi:hypothetical protein